MPPTPAISVILPFRNNEKTIRGSIESILAQSFQDFELIVIDDASEDHGAAVVREIRDPRIRFIQNEEHRGQSASRNAGFQQARGRFLAPMDGDDICPPHRLEQTWRNLDENPEHGLCGGWARVVGGRWPGILMRQPTGAAAVRALFLLGMPFFHTALLFRKDALDRHQLSYDETMIAGADYDLGYRCAQCFPVDNVASVILKYYTNPTGVSSTSGHKATELRLNRLRTELNRLLNRSPTEEELRFHASLGNGGGAVDAADLLRRREWLEKLVEANQDCRIYDQVGVLKAVAFVWFRICRNSSHLGLDAWRAWKRSSWRRYDQPLAEEILSCLGSWGLSRLSRRRRKPQGELRGL